MIELLDTDSNEIAAEFLRSRRSAGSPAMGMVMTLVFVVDEDAAEDAMETARSASREHPARVLGVMIGDGRGAGQVDAQVGIGSGWTGETALIQLTGAVTKHPESVVLPLLLPDSPVVVWWPAKAPADPAADPLGRLAQRRITDAAAVPTGKAKAMLTQCHAYAPGNTDLAWTRITPWRALLAAALDQHPGKVTSASVTAERISPSADLLSAWLADRLKVKVDRQSSDGPGHHPGGAQHQAPGTSRWCAPTASWRRCPPRASPTGRWRSSGVSSTSCSPRSCAGSTPTTSTPHTVKKLAKLSKA